MGKQSVLEYIKGIPFRATEMAQGQDFLGWWGIVILSTLVQLLWGVWRRNG